MLPLRLPASKMPSNALGPAARRRRAAGPKTQDGSAKPGRRGCGSPLPFLGQVFVADLTRVCAGAGFLAANDQAVQRVDIGLG